MLGDELFTQVFELGAQTEHYLFYLLKSVKIHPIQWSTEMLQIAKSHSDFHCKGDRFGGFIGANLEESLVDHWNFHSVGYVGFTLGRLAQPEK